MSNRKEIQTRQLGMNPSTAQHALKKQILFSLVQKCGEDVCYQCGKKIESEKELSVEHKIPWLHSENPVDLFFDLNNIAFSHLSCNVRAARRPRKGSVAPCGTVSKYIYHKCRCDLCKEAKKKHHAAGYSSDARKARYVRTGK